MSTVIRTLRATTVLVALFFFTPISNAAPTAEVHSLDWYVHIDLIDQSAGLDLAYWQQFLSDRIAQSNVLLQGTQGPVDNGCCVELEPATVSTFGSPGDGLDVVMSAAALASVQANGPGAYLVQTLQFCAGLASTGIRGCADEPGDFFVVALDADDTGFLPTLIAHERGHNAGLGHTSSPGCGLMNASNNGGCVTVGQCTAFKAAADATGDLCECLPDTVGSPPLAMGTSCGGDAVCSEGLCDHIDTLAGAVLMTSAGPGSSSGNPPEEILAQSAAAGGWRTTGAGGSEITGLAYDADNDVLYGLEALPGDDALVTLDPISGEVLSTIASLPGRSNATALAFDPSPGADRLLAIHVDDDFFGQSCASVGVTPPCVSELFEIDPMTGAVERLGELQHLVIREGVSGLAWNETGGALYGSSRAGIEDIDLASCTGFVCSSARLETTFRQGSALTWDETTARLLREGDNGFGASRIDVVDPETGALESTIGIEEFSAGGLAIRSVPEPGASAGLVAGALLLAAFERRRLGA